MKRLFKSRFRFIAIPLLAIACVFLVSSVVMWLWNYTLPELVGAKTINLWQSMALFFLCKVLFGFGKGGGPKRGRAPWMRKSMHTPSAGIDETEEEQIKAYMRSRWCQWGDRTAATDNRDNVGN